MDLFHRKSQGEDTRIGRECQFCCYTDPEFITRSPMDRLVYTKMGDVASGHITEEGYLRHRIAELKKKRETGFTGKELLKSA